MERRIEIDGQDTRDKNQYYTHAIVSYATMDEITNLLCQAKHWAYIYHDRDENRDPHYHIIATFGTAKSYNTVRKLVKSEQNTFSQHVKAKIGNVLTYFIHATDASVKAGKQPYNESEIEYDDEEYWRKQALSNGEEWYGEKAERKISNDEFMDDLLSSDLSVVAMGRKYGRDFIKNFQSYMAFRNLCFQENPQLRPKMKNDPIDELITTIFEKGDYSVNANGEVIQEKINFRSN